MPTNICPHCGVDNPQGSNFCNYCGTELLEPRIDQSTTNAEEISSSTQNPTDGSPPSDTVQITPPAADDQTSSEPSPPVELHPPSLAQRPVQEDAEPTPQPEPTVQELFSDIVEQSAATDNPLSLLPKSKSTQALTTDEGISNSIKGLLEPQTIVGESIEKVSRSKETTSPVEDVDLTRISALMTSETNLTVESEQMENRSPVTLQIPWVFALLALFLAFPIFFEFPGPVGAAKELPSVAAAFETISGLDKPVVLLLWAYDPATAGEMDQAVEPVLRHLEAKGNQIVLASTLPTGPATARRMLNKIQSTTQLRESSTYAELGYLPGGTAVLSLLGQARRVARPVNLRQPSALLDSQPDLVLVAAAQAEEVQQWLEQGQPLNQTATVAVTSAAADPYLRPYLDSGQLSGLVSGFDGGIAYHRLYDETVLGSTASLSGLQLRQQIYQNWGHLAIFIIILMGNFSMLSNRNVTGKTSGTVPKGSLRAGERSGV